VAAAIVAVVCITLLSAGAHRRASGRGSEPVKLKNFNVGRAYLPGFAAFMGSTVTIPLFLQLTALHRDLGRLAMARWASWPCS